MKKIIAFFCVLTLLVSTAYASQIYKSEEIIPIADGVTLTKVKSFYSDHNLSYSVIRADLSNENVGVSLLTPYTGTDSLDTVGNIAISYPDAVAAMNADFFSTVSGGKALSLGIEIQDGKLLQSPINPDTMATFYEKDSVADISYLGFKVMVVAPNWQYEPVAHINKHTTYYGSILMYTPDFNGGYSPAPGGEVVEVVVDNGIITEFRRNMPSVKIPENGYVLVVSEGSTMFFANNFAVGDPVKLDWYVTPDILNSDTAIGGGAMLVSEGKALKNFSHVISGYNPRSALGIDKSGTTLYLVAVNGRSTESRGMTMSELALLMEELGCYKAVNLDGGGSTNMVASTVWNEKIHTVNSPSENRRVVNAVGITYSAESGTPYGIRLEADEDVCFIGQSVDISYAVHDKNLRPVSASAFFSSDKGNFSGNTFTAEQGGDAHIYATSGEANGALSIYVVDKIAGINAEGPYRLSVGEKDSIRMSVFDEYGHNCSIRDFSRFSFSSSNPSVVYADSEGIIHAVGNGSAAITVSYNNVSTSIAVTVGSSGYDYYDSFDDLNGEFSSYPAYVGGNYELSDDFCRSEGTSGRLYYDFTSDTDATKAAYLSLSSPVILSDDESEISVYVKTDEDFSHSVKALCTDGSSNALYLTFKKVSEDGDFDRYTATVPAGTARPISLSRLYVAALSGEAQDEGFVYFDDLSFRAAENAPLPFVPLSVYSDSMAGSLHGRTFKVGSAENSGTLLSKLARERLLSEFSDGSPFALLGLDNEKAVNKRNVFNAYEDADALYLSVNPGSGGIRKTSSAQWDSIIASLAQTAKNNIFILSETSLFSTDEFENEAIRSLLSAYAAIGKNVFVISRGNECSLTIKDGVRYFTLSDMSSDASSLTKTSGYSYLEFSLGSDPSYRWCSVFN